MDVKERKAKLRYLVRMIEAESPEIDLSDAIRQLIREVEELG